MVFISIGQACNVKHQIDKHVKKNETLFFDWLLTDMNSVVKILQCKNIKEFLNEENIIISSYDSNNATITFKTLSRCVSIHDLKQNYSHEDLNLFIEKYERRFNRFINYIKSNEKIFFIRYDCDKSLINEFIQTIHEINNNCNFYLVLINYSSKQDIFLKENNFIEITLNHDSSNYEWTTSFIDWNKIFTYLNNI